MRWRLIPNLHVKHGKKNMKTYTALILIVPASCSPFVDIYIQKMNEAVQSDLNGITFMTLEIMKTRKNFLNK